VAKKKKDLGIYKNNLEYYCGSTLDKNGYKFNYEERFIIMEGFTYPSSYYKSTPKSKKLIDATGKKILPISYKPDFVIHKEKVIIETKGFVRANDSFPLRWKIFMDFLMKTGMADYRLFIPKNQKQVDEIIEILNNETRKTK